MTVIRLRARVPEDRHLTLELPPEVPVGEADIELVVHPASGPVTEFTVTLPPDDRPRVFPARPTHPKLAAEHDAFERMLPELLTRHRNEFVAVHDGKVVAAGPDRVTTATRAHELLPGVLTLVRMVTDEPQPIPRLPIFREVRRDSP